MDITIDLTSLSDEELSTHRDDPGHEHDEEDPQPAVPPQCSGREHAQADEGEDEDRHLEREPAGDPARRCMRRSSTRTAVSRSTCSSQASSPLVSVAIAVPSR